MNKEIKSFFKEFFYSLDAARIKYVAISINDKTRPVPNSLLLPPLLEALKNKGIGKDQVKLFIASGTHSPMRKDEFNLILPASIIENYSVYPHNCDITEDLSYLGITSRNTPVFVNAPFYSADLKIVVGDIEPHHFAGFSGGVKSAAIGLGGRETINKNHALLLDDNSSVGKYDNNPLRQDIEEIGEMIGVDFAINAVLDENKNILKVFCGDPHVVMHEGIEYSRKLSLLPIPEQYDLVIASAGGYPKDINFYQAQKALTHASLFCKPGGMVFLLAECIEGIGSDGYFSFMQGVNSHAQVIDKFKEIGFEVGPHKAFQVAKIAERIHFKLLSSIPQNILATLLIDPIIDLQSEIDNFCKIKSKDAKIAILPFATASIPEYQEKQ